MIQLQKGQPLYDNPSLVVYDPDGYYNDGDTVICASAGTPDEAVCRYEAQFIAYGGIVYSISDPDQLLAEILKIDPASLFGKNSDQLAQDKLVQDITQQEPDPTPPDDPQDPPPDDPPDPQVPDTSTSTPEVPDVPNVPDTSTTTDATSTPDVPYDPSGYGETLTAPPNTPATTTDATTSDAGLGEVLGDASSTDATDISTTTTE